MMIEGDLGALARDAAQDLPAMDELVIRLDRTAAACAELAPARRHVDRVATAAAGAAAVVSGLAIVAAVSARLHVLDAASPRAIGASVIAIALAAAALARRLASRRAERALPGDDRRLDTLAVGLAIAGVTTVLAIVGAFAVSPLESGAELPADADQQAMALGLLAAIPLTTLAAFVVARGGLRAVRHRAVLPAALIVLAAVVTLHYQVALEELALPLGATVATRITAFAALFAIASRWALRRR